MFRIGVVEDDQSHLDRVASHLERFQRDHGETFHVTAFRDGAELLHGYTPEWDILLLDIQMDRVDGMTAARRIREVDPEVIIVFITSSPQYAIVGYEVDALSYLLKPVDYPAFEQEIARCLVRLSRRERRHLLFTTRDGAKHRVDLGDITFLESARHHVIVHTLEGDHTVVTSLKAMEAELGDGFVRCNSGYLVGLRHVTGVDGNDCRIRGGALLQISRPRKKAFLEALAAHIGSRGSTP